MSAIDRVREKFGNLQSAASKTCKSASAGSAGSPPKESEKFAPLSAGFEHRIRAMAERWRYQPHELLDVLQRAQHDPVAWERAVALDERREAEFRDCGLLPTVDA